MALVLQVMACGSGFEGLGLGFRTLGLRVEGSGFEGGFRDLGLRAQGFRV